MNRRTRILTSLAGMSLLAATMPASGHDASTDATNYFFVEGFAVQHQERIPEREVGYGGRVGVGFPLSERGLGPTAIELGVFANPIAIKDGADGNQTGVMADLVQNFRLGGFNPYVFAGVGSVDEHIGPVDANVFALEAGLGVMFSVFREARLRLGFSAQSVHDDKIRADKDRLVDARFSVGLMWPFLLEPAPAPAPRAVDSDGDGLVDNKDACPSIPASTADGCPPPPPPPPVVQTDSDGDGVYDAEDKCAGTLEGLKVDASGCAVQTEAQSVVLKGVTFLPNSATLTPEAKAVLDSAAASLSGQMELKVELGGHTDSQGRDATNLALSQKRADAVRQYLVGKGIAADRLIAKGYGETQPIADNDTVEGRQENRRVELKIVK